METTLTIAPKGIPAIPYMAEQVQRIDTQVPTVKSVESTPTLPADKVFVAQVVNARLSGIAFPENPAEIAPPERTLKPYDVPMLPYVKEEANSTVAAAKSDASSATNAAQGNPLNRQTGAIAAQPQTAASGPTI